MKAVTVDGVVHLCLFATACIEPGDEITYSYGADKECSFPWRKQVCDILYHKSCEYNVHSTEPVV